MTPTVKSSMVIVITEFWNAGSSPFHCEFKYMMNQFPPTTMNPKKKMPSPRNPPRKVNFWT